MAGSFKCDNELWGSIKCGEFLDYLRLLLLHGFVYLIHKRNRKVETVSPKYRFAQRYIVGIRYSIHKNFFNASNPS